MAEKRTSDTAGSKAITERIRILLRDRWHGNQNEMARAVGCSQSALSRLVRGETPPGKRVVKMIAACPGVDPNWLHHGTARRGTVSHTPASATLPVLRELLPVPPAQGKSNTEGHTFPVAAAEYSRSRCWYEVPPNAPILKSDEARLAPRDMLLLDYAPPFNDQIELDGRLAVAWAESQATGINRHIALGLVRYRREADGERDLRLETGQPWHSLWSNVQYVAANATIRDLVSGKTIRLQSVTVPAIVKSDGHVEPLPPTAFVPVSYAIRVADILALCVAVYRR
jgi:transcriptional regulator with XRE-family HTH domain